MSPAEAAKKLAEEFYTNYLLIDDSTSASMYYKISEAFYKFATLLESESTDEG